MQQRRESHQVIERLADGCGIERQEPQLTDVLQRRSFAEKQPEMRAAARRCRCLQDPAVQRYG